MKQFLLSMLAAAIVVALHVALFSHKKPADQPPAPPVPEIEASHVMITLIQQNSAPNYRLIFDVVDQVGDSTSAAPSGWKIVSRGQAGDIIKFKPSSK